jgi:hypothetical protein
MHDNSATTFFTVLNSTVEEHGCRIENIDFDRQVINLEGPDEAVEACAKAIADLLD